MKKILPMLLITWFSLQVQAQDVTRPDNSPPILADYPSTLAVESAADINVSVPIPVEYLPGVTEDFWSFPVAWSFFDTISWNPRNSFGFSLGANEGYISNVYPNSIERQSSTLTALSARVFTNVGRAKSRLHLNYEAGYKAYHQEDSMSGVNHHGSMNYVYRPSSKTEFQLWDTFSHSLNDPLDTNTAFLSDFNLLPNTGYEVYFIPQRTTQNSVQARFSINLTSSTRVNINGLYNSYWYERSFNDVHTAQGGIGLNQRVTDWLSLSTSYSIYLNDVSEDLRDHQVHRVEIGGLQFNLSQNIELLASGGIEIADMGTGSEYKIKEMAQVNISRKTPTNTLYASYQRTMSSVLGYRRILPSDIVSIGLGQRITDKTNFQLNGAYRRSRDFNDSGLLQSYSGGAQFEYALTSTLFASVNYSYQYQNNSIRTLADIPHFDRSMAFVGLQYAWPPLQLGGK